MWWGVSKHSSVIKVPWNGNSIYISTGIPFRRPPPSPLQSKDVKLCRRSRYRASRDERGVSDCVSLLLVNIDRRARHRSSAEPLFRIFELDTISGHIIRRIRICMIKAARKETKGWILINSICFMIHVVWLGWIGELSDWCYTDHRLGTCRSTLDTLLTDRMQHVSEFSDTARACEAIQLVRAQFSGDLSSLTITTTLYKTCSTESRCPNPCTSSLLVH